MLITYYHRRPATTHFSVELFFEDVRKALPPQIEARIVQSRFSSQGVFKRAYNICEAPFSQGDVNHITGDVHYLTYLLDKKRTLLTILDCVSLQKLTGWRKTLLFFLWYWLPERRCKLISVISESTRQELLVYLPQAVDKIKVIHCPVSEKFNFHPKSFNTRPVLLQVGTGQNKNLLRTIQAIKGIPCHLRIIGRLNHEHLRALDENAIDYSSTSNVSGTQIVQEYIYSDVVVFPSTYEGFGIPILEAQATGRPVVTSNIWSMPEVAGAGGHLVDPYSVDSIREGILHVINNAGYRTQLIAKGRENAAKYHPEIIANQYVEIYQDLSRWSK